MTRSSLLTSPDSTSAASSSSASPSSRMLARHEASVAHKISAMPPEISWEAQAPRSSSRNAPLAAPLSPQPRVKRRSAPTRQRGFGRSDLAMSSRVALPGRGQTAQPPSRQLGQARLAHRTGAESAHFLCQNGYLKGTRGRTHLNLALPACTSAGHSSISASAGSSNLCATRCAASASRSSHRYTTLAKATPLWHTRTFTGSIPAVQCWRSSTTTILAPSSRRAGRHLTRFRSSAMPKK